MIKQCLGCATLAATLCGGAGHAVAESSWPELTLNGYGTAGVSYADDKTLWEEFYAARGAERSRHWSPDLDSRLGIQLTAEFSDRLTAVVQVVSEYHYDNTYQPEVEWANLKYDVTDNLSVRAGRIRQSMFMYADSRKVGYIYPWVRLPVDLYGAPVSSNDGVDVTYSRRFGEARNTINLSYGSIDFDVTGAAEAGSSRARDTFAVTNRFETGDWTLFASYYRTKLTIPSVDSLVDVFRAFGQEGQAIADRLAVDEVPYRFYSVGFNYDPGQWFAMGEWAKIRSNSLLGKNTPWYLSAGFRVGNLTPFVLYSRGNTNNDKEFRGLTLSTLPEDLRGVAAQLNENFDARLNANLTQRTTSLGVRWDLTSGIALKLQYDRRSQSNSLENDDRETDIFSATIDFVF